MVEALYGRCKTDILSFEEGRLAYDVGRIDVQSRTEFRSSARMWSIEQRATRNREEIDGFLLGGEPCFAVLRVISEDGRGSWSMCALSRERPPVDCET